jgi:hypothetical protein
MARVPLKFPHCPACGTDSPQSFHKDCGGEIQLDPHSNYVHCTRDGKSWLIWDTKYHCNNSSCGHVFSANEVYSEITKMLKDCERLLDILMSQEKAIADMTSLGKISFRAFATAFAKGFGKVAGYLVEILVGLLFSV